MPDCQEPATGVCTAFGFLQAAGNNRGVGRFRSRALPEGYHAQAQGHWTQMKTAGQHPLQKILESRIAIIDGAMGTTIRTYGMTEADIRGERFKDSKKDLLNNGDLFSLTQPDMICDIHRRFLEAGADIIETNTFGATSITQSEFFVDDPREHGGRKDPAFYQKIIEDPFLNGLAWEINEQSARQCREWADRVANATARQRFVAGAIGPLTVSLSNSPDADDSGFRVVTFDQVKAAYTQQVRALIAGGSDLLLVETIFDSLNAKAALVAIREVFDQDGKELPVMISAAVGRGGETMISAQTIEAFWNAVEHVKPLSVGLNCSLGPDLMYPFLEELSEKSSAAISCYPNAGLPNPLSPTGFDLEPADMARYLGDFAHGGLINIAGGCCGNTPEHIAAIAKALEGQAPRERRTKSASAESVTVADAPVIETKPLRLSGSQPFTQQAGVYIMIGERTNVAGSPKFAKLIKDRQIRRSSKRRPAAGGERSQRHRHLHGRGHDRRRRGDDPLPAVAGERARGRQSALHGGLLEMGGHRGGAQMPAGQGHRELDLAEGRRREISPERRDRAQVWRGGGGDGLRRAGPGRDVRRQDPHLRTRLPDPGRRGRFPARRHHLRSRTSSPLPPAWRSTTTTRWTSSTPRAGSRPTCRTRR